MDQLAKGSLLFFGFLVINLAYKKLESLNVKNSNKEELTNYLSQLFERKIWFWT